jgi:hypothetical protein
MKKPSKTAAELEASIGGGEAICDGTLRAFKTEYGLKV